MLRLDLVHHRLDALLELAAVLGARDHQGQVQRHHALAAQQLRHVAFGHRLGQAFHDGRLAHARLAQQHRVVLGAAAEDLDHALDFLFAADHRVQLALDGQLGQVAPEGGQRGRLAVARRPLAGAAPSPPGAPAAGAAASPGRRGILLVAPARSSDRVPS